MALGYRPWQGDWYGYVDSLSTAQLRRWLPSLAAGGLDCGMATAVVAVLRPRSSPAAETQAVASTLASVAPRARDAGHDALQCIVILLGDFAPPSAAPLLCEILADRSLPDWLRADAAEALRDYRDAPSERSLVVHLDDPEPRVRFDCCFALGDRGATRALRSLRRVRRHDEAVIERWGSVADEAARAIEVIHERRHWDRTCKPHRRHAKRALIRSNCWLL